MVIWKDFKNTPLPPTFDRRIWIVESPFFIWINEIPLFYLKNWKSLFLFEEIEFPFFIWRNWTSLFYLTKWNPFILFEELKVHFFNWRNWIPFFYLKKLKVPFLFEEMKSLYFIWRLLRIFDVKTNWIIGQKSQNSTRYAGALRKKITFFGRVGAKTNPRGILYQFLIQFSITHG